MSNYPITNFLVSRYNSPAFGFVSTWRGIDDEPHEEGMLRQNMAKMAACIPVLGLFFAAAFFAKGYKDYKASASERDEKAAFKMKALGITHMILGVGSAIVGPLVLIGHVAKTIFDHVIIPFVKLLCLILSLGSNVRANNIPGGERAKTGYTILKGIPGAFRELKRHIPFLN